MKKHCARNGMLLGAALVAAWALHATDNTQRPKMEDVNLRGLGCYLKDEWYSLEEMKTLFAAAEKRYAESDAPIERSDLCVTLTSLTRAMRRVGGRAAHPFLVEKSLAANLKHDVRSDIAVTYLASNNNMDECITFMRKWYFTMEGDPWFRWDAFHYFMGEVRKKEGKMDKETLDNIREFLLEIVEKGDENSISETFRADTFLMEHLPGYADSRQRATLARYAGAGGDDFLVERFAAIKEHFDAIPPSERPDIYATPFPPPPPSAEEAEKAGKPETPEKTGFPRVWLAVGTAALLFKTKKSRAP